MTLLLALLIAAPSPAPQPTVPVDLDRFCETHGAGDYVGLVLSRAVPHVVIRCSKAAFVCAKTCERVEPFPGIKGPP